MEFLNNKNQELPSLGMKKNIFFYDNPPFFGIEMSIYLYKKEQYSITTIGGDLNSNIASAVP